MAFIELTEAMNDIHPKIIINKDQIATVLDADDLKTLVPVRDESYKHAKSGIQLGNGRLLMVEEPYEVIRRLLIV